MLFETNKTTNNKKNDFYQSRTQKTGDTQRQMMILMMNNQIKNQRLAENKTTTGVFVCDNPADIANGILFERYCRWVV